ncbi:MAG: hypothetical protein AB1746_02050 [Candidatus Zixiibacteriota bacterium]
MKIIPYILYLFFLALHLIITKDIIVIYGAGIDMAVLIITLIALYKSETTTLWFAVCAGIILGSVRLDLMTWEILALVIPALIVHQVGTRINLESVTSRLILMAGFLLIHQSIIALVISGSDFLTLIYRTILPGAVYTLIIGGIAFQILDGRITWKKIKALF